MNRNDKTLADLIVVNNKHIAKVLLSMVPLAIPEPRARALAREGAQEAVDLFLEMIEREKL